MIQEEEAIRFVQLTDSHVRADDRFFRGVDTIEALGQAVAMIDDTVRFVVHTGDLISRPADTESYEVYRSIVEGVGCPIRHIPGNHDDTQLMKTALGGDGEYPWDFTIQGVRFIGLDSASGVLGTDQLNRLATLLTNKEPAVVFLHHHLCPMDRSWLNQFALEDTDALAEVLDGARARVLALIHGHIHFDGTFDFHGIPVYSAPALTAQFDPYGEFLDISPGPPAFVEFTLSRNQELVRTVRTVRACEERRS
ncbi:MAG: metallophosphoesterase [Spirochaeta sp.]|jgi:Icc protein|nr:metallophosphoesterase [Spirochaeta sp.]